VYYFPEPPYFLLVFGLFAGITSGAAFEATLRQRVREWSKNRSSRTLAQMKGFELLIPFLGIAAGICVFLSAGCLTQSRYPSPYLLVSWFGHNWVNF